MSLRRSLLCALFLAAFALPALWGAAPPSPRPDPATVARWIAQLGSETFEEREKASERLAELDYLPPALEAATRSTDLEAQRRAERIVTVIRERLLQRELRVLLAELNEDGAELFLDRMGLQEGFATEARWKLLGRVAEGLAKRAKELGGAVTSTGEKDRATLPLKRDLVRGAAFNSRVLVDGHKGIVGALHDCFLVSSGSMDQFNSVANSVLFINGDVQSFNSTTNSIIFCTGTIHRMNFTRNCLVVVLKEVKSHNCSEHNCFDMRVPGTANASTGNVYVGHKPTSINVSKGDSFPEPRQRLIDLVRRFEPARSGVAYRMVEGDAEVEKLAADRVFAKAGLKLGDRILAIDGVKFNAADDFERLLRRTFLPGRHKMKVQRGDRVVEVGLRSE